MIPEGWRIMKHCLRSIVSVLKGPEKRPNGGEFTGYHLGQFHTTGIPALLTHLWAAHIFAAGKHPLARGQFDLLDRPFPRVVIKGRIGRFG